MKTGWRRPCVLKSVPKDRLLARWPHGTACAATARSRNPGALRSWAAARTATARRKSGITESGKPASASGASGHARLLLTTRIDTARSASIDVGKHELPLVVVVATLVKTNRLLFTLAHDADNPSRTGLSSGSTAAQAGPRARGLGRIATLCRAPCRTLRTSGTRVGAGVERLKLAVLRHGVLVFLAKVASLDENLDTWRKGPILELIQANGPRVLLSPED